MKAYSGWFCFVLLLGAVAGFTAGKWDATAQTVDNKTSRYLGGTVTYGQSADAFMLFDSQTNRLAVYTVDAVKRLQLLCVRETSWDFKPVAWGQQTPPVQEMKEAFDKAEREKFDKLEKPEKK